MLKNDVLNDLGFVQGYMLTFLLLKKKKEHS